MDQSCLGNTTSEDAPMTSLAETTGLLIFYSCVVVVGVPGNCLIIRVFWGKPLKSSTHVLIMGLAAADLVVCLLRVWEIALQSLGLAGISMGHLTIFSVAVVYTANATSITITTAIALDRYDCVCRPHRRLMTAYFAKKALLVSVGTSLVTNIPLYIKLALGNGGRSNVALRTAVYTFELTMFVIVLGTIALCYTKVFLAIRKHVRLGVLDRGSACQARTVGAPVFTVSSTAVEMGETPGAPTRSQPRIVSNVTALDSADDTDVDDVKSHHISVLPKRHDKTGTTSTSPPQLLAPDRRRRRKSTVPALQRRTTAMLFITSVVFILAWLPYWISVFFDIFGESSHFLNTLVKVLYLNSAVNPFIYGLANRRFRKDCREVFNRRR